MAAGDPDNFNYLRVHPGQAVTVSTGTYVTSNTAMLCGAHDYERDAVCRNERGHTGAHHDGVRNWTWVDSPSHMGTQDFRTPTEARRFRLFGLAVRHLPSLLSGKLRVANMPQDGEVLRVHYDHLRDEMALLVAHASFAEVLDHCESPYAALELETVEED